MSRPTIIALAIVALVAWLRYGIPVSAGVIVYALYFGAIIWLARKHGDKLIWFDRGAGVRRKLFVDLPGIAFFAGLAYLASWLDRIMSAVMSLALTISGLGKPLVY